MEKQIIVDVNDNVIDAKYRNEIEPTDIYRVSTLWLRDSKGNALLAQRSFDKKNDPGVWQPAVAGTVSEGESYLENIKREAEEELGLTGLDFEVGPKGFVDEKAHRFFSQIFFATIDKQAEDFTIQRDEVEQVKWTPERLLLEDVKKNPQNYVLKMDELVETVSAQLLK
jgi:isopentenyldiphosphate isomerase